MLGVVLGVMLSSVLPVAQAPSKPVVLADYGDFDQAWDVRGDRKRIPEVYTVRADESGPILSVRMEGKPIRIFKKISWNPFTHPVLKWKWRALRWPEDPEASIALYVSLDRDAIGIPTITKYLWSAGMPVGKTISGGFFSPNQVVIRSGTDSVEKWFSQRLDVLKSFREIHREDPPPAAVGIGLLVGEGIEMEISQIEALAPSQ